MRKDIPCSTFVSTDMSKSRTKYFGPEVISYVSVLYLGLLSYPLPHSMLFCLKIVLPSQLFSRLILGGGGGGEGSFELE